MASVPRSVQRCFLETLSYYSKSPEGTRGVLEELEKFKRVLFVSKLPRLWSTYGKHKARSGFRSPKDTKHHETHICPKSRRPIIARQPITNITHFTLNKKKFEKNWEKTFHEAKQKKQSTQNKPKFLCVSLFERLRNKNPSAATQSLASCRWTLTVGCMVHMKSFKFIGSQSVL